MIAAALPLFVSLGTCAPTVDVEKELLIRASQVVHSPDAAPGGKLGFGSMFRRLVRAESLEAARLAVPGWLAEWGLDRTTEGVPSVPRSTAALEALWPKDSDGSFSLERAPWTLAAVVFRPDLQAVLPDGTTVDGELRFVFNLINPEDGSPRQLTAIFEFPLARQPGFSWFAAVHGLGSLELGAEYLEGLESLVDRLDPTLGRLRTNDFFLAFEWDLREFHAESPGRLRLVPLPLTPPSSENDGEAAASLAAWVLDHSSDVENGAFDLPLELRTAQAFDPNEGFKWLADAGLPEALRRKFSIQTCSGCHAGETQTRFTHIQPVSTTGLPARISSFLEQDLQIRQAILVAQLCGSRDASARLMKARRGRVH